MPAGLARATGRGAWDSENVLGGFIRWTDYRGREAPNAIRIIHHKTGAVVLHPLEEATPGGVLQFYAEAEDVLSHLPRRGVPMILHEGCDGTAKLFSFGGMQRPCRYSDASLGCQQPSRWTPAATAA